MMPLGLEVKMKTDAGQGVILHHNGMLGILLCP